MDGRRAWRWCLEVVGVAEGLVIQHLAGGRLSAPLCSAPQYAAWLQLGWRAPKLFGQLRLSNFHVILGEREGDSSWGSAMGERSSPIRSSAPHFWQRSPRQLRLHFANYVLTFLDLKTEGKSGARGSSGAGGLEVIGFVSYRFLLVELISPKEVKWNEMNSTDLVETIYFFVFKWIVLQSETILK